tara:strand:+ start:1882 stop:2187 length:306 start_codon:yes stop_codon:yes gene_type:complete
MGKTIEEMVQELDAKMSNFKNMFKRHEEKSYSVFGDKETRMRKPYSKIDIFFYSKKNEYCAIWFIKNSNTPDVIRFEAFGENSYETTKKAHDYFITQGNDL